MAEELTDFQKFRNHVKTIMTHRKIVCKWCFKMGIPINGILHDLSKYSPTEISIYKFYSGNRSPHDNARDAIGYSPSWYAHPHRNRHHWEHWVDDWKKETAVKIPYKYIIEMFCDFVGAGQVYLKDKWTKSSPLQYHLACRKNRIFNPESKFLLELLLFKMDELGPDEFLEWYNNEKWILKDAYNLNMLGERYEYKINER